MHLLWGGGQWVIGLSVVLQAAMLPSALSWTIGEQRRSRLGSGDMRSMQEAESAPETVPAASILAVGLLYPGRGWSQHWPQGSWEAGHIRRGSSRVLLEANPLCPYC